MRNKIMFLSVVGLSLLFVVSSLSAAVIHPSSAENNVLSSTEIFPDTMHPSQETADGSEVISVDYYFKAPVLKPVMVGEETYDEIVMADVSMYTTPHQPVLPYVGANVILPYGTTVDSVQVLSSGKILVGSQKTIIPGVTLHPDSYTGPTELPTPDETVYHSLEAFPSSLYTYGGTQSSKGVAIATILLNPVVFIPASGEVWYYPHLTLILHLIKSSEMNTLFRGLDRDYETVLSSSADNINAIDSYRDARTSNTITRKYDLLIITTPALKNGFTPLIRAHALEGVTTMVRTVGLFGDIPNGSTVNQTCENIRNYIRQMYQRWGIEYVLLGGDIDVVPAPHLFFGQYGGTVIGPSDFYYACLDGPYNYDGDNLWGEPHDGIRSGDVDLRSEVSVGRACVGNMSEVGIFVNKTLRYMHTDPNDPYLQKVLMAGEHLFDGNPPIYGDDYMKEITPIIPQDHFSFRTLYDSEWQLHNWTVPFKGGGGWPNDLMINEINNGTHIINHLGHSGSFANMKLFLYYLSHEGSDLDYLNNTNLAFMYSEGCSAGAFDLDAWLAHGIPDCIAEYFTVKRPYGAFAGIWNSRDGFASDNILFHKQFWNAVFNRGISVISKANQVSKEDNIPGILSSQKMRWTCYQLTFFGDPALAFRCPLHASANGPYTALVGQPLQFTGAGVGGHAPYRYEWDFMDGAGIRTKKQNPVIKYTATGTYTVILKVIDAAGRIDINQTTVTVAENLVADPQGPYAGVPHVPMWFMGEATGGFPPYTWLWAFGDGQSCDMQNATQVYENPGTYNVTFTVTDMYGHQSVATTTAFIHQPLPVVWVDDDYNETTEGWGYDHFNRIANGVFITAPGGTLYVANGTYEETVCITQPMHLIGENRDGTSILSPGWDCGICIYSNSVTVSGFTIRDSSGLGVFVNGNENQIVGNRLINERRDGISLVSASDNIIADNIIVDNGATGIEVMMISSRNSFVDNTITGNGRGIDLFNSCNDNIIGQSTIQNNGYSGITITSCDRTQIIGNTITDHDAYDVQLYYSTSTQIEQNTILRSTYTVAIQYSSDRTTIVGNTVGFVYLESVLSAVISDNEFESGGISILGWSLPEWNTHVIENNRLNGRPMYYVKDTSGPYVIPSDAAQVICANCSNVTMSGLTVDNVYSAVQLAYSPDCRVEDSTITVIFSPGGPFITSSAVALVSSPRSLVQESRLSNGTNGVDIQNSPNSIFRNNTISWNSAGITSDASHGNLIIDNVIHDNEYGLIMYNPSHDVLCGNTIANSSMYGLFFVFCFDNLVYHNNFIDNREDVYDTQMNSYNLSYPFGGNYWSDYNGVDSYHGAGQNITGQDNIGDIPYLSSNVIDHYPLMVPWGFRLQGTCYYENQQPVHSVELEVLNMNTGETWFTGPTDEHYQFLLQPGQDVFIGNTLQITAWDLYESLTITEHVITQQDLDNGLITLDLILNVH